MNKAKSKSDYAVLLEKYNGLKKNVSMDVIIDKLKKFGEVEKRLKDAESTLNKIIDLINSNEDLVHFYTTKNELRKPIEDYFRKEK